MSTAKKKNSQGRCIDRTTYQDAIDRNTLNVKSRKEEYRRRQAIVEHHFDELMNSDDNQHKGPGDLQMSEPQSGGQAKEGRDILTD